MHQSQADWAELIAEVRVEMERGTDPASERVQELARRWTDLVRGFTGGNPEIEKSLRSLLANEGPAIAERYGDGMPDSAVGEYISRAMAAQDSV